MSIRCLRGLEVQHQRTAKCEGNAHRNLEKLTYAANGRTNQRDQRVLSFRGFSLPNSEAIKIMSSGALGALFFSFSTPMPTSDPECFPPVEPWAHVIQTITVGVAA